MGAGVLSVEGRGGPRSVCHEAPACASPQRGRGGKACDLNLENSISQVIFFTAAFTPGTPLQQFTMLYLCPPCSIYPLVSDPFVDSDFCVYLRSRTISAKSNAMANFIQFNLAIIT